MLCSWQGDEVFQQVNYFLSLLSWITLSLVILVVTSNPSILVTLPAQHDVSELFNEIADQLEKQVTMHILRPLCSIPKHFSF